MEIAENWRHPKYLELEGLKELDADRYAMTKKDYKAVIENDAQCNLIRQNLIDLIDTLREPK